MRALGAQPSHNVTQHRIHLTIGNRFLAPVAQDFDKAAHVSSLVFLGQIDRKPDARQNRLESSVFCFDQKRQMHIIDAYLLNRDSPHIGKTLNIFQTSSLPS